MKNNLFNKVVSVAILVVLGLMSLLIYTSANTMYDAQSRLIQELQFHTSDNKDLIKELSAVEYAIESRNVIERQEAYTRKEAMRFALKVIDEGKLPEITGETTTDILGNKFPDTREEKLKRISNYVNSVERRPEVSVIAIEYLAKFL